MGGIWTKEYIIPESHYFYYYAYNITEDTYNIIKSECAEYHLPHPNSVEYMGWNIFHIIYDNGKNEPAPGHYGIRAQI